MKIWMRLIVLGGLVAGTLTACSSQAPRPGVIISYGDTEVVMSSLDEDPFSDVDLRSATRQDVLTVQTDLMCKHPQGISTLQERTFISTSLEKEGISPDSFDKLTSEILITSDFMDEMAMEMNLRCPAQLTQLMSR